MKYQIYLNKKTSEAVNAIAKSTGKKPATFIKEFFEKCFAFSEETLGEEALEMVREYGRK